MQFFKDLILAESKIDQVVSLLKANLNNREPYVLWLDAPMGAGKTTLVRHLIWSMGLDRDIPVVSPTYTLMNEYQIGNKWYAHVDLYRVTGHFNLEETGVLDARSFAAIFVEWPKVPENSERISPDYVLRIEYEGENQRRYTFEKLSR